jgi:hypothetical protein
MSIRADLGDFNSILCFKALVVGIEESLGDRAATVALKAAGRKRGHQLVKSLDVTGKGPEQGAEAAKMLDAAIGKEGTRLCRVDNIEREGTTFRVHLSETVCSAGEPQGSPRQLTFTAGAVHGALEALYGQKLSGAQVGSVLRGQTHDILEFVPR